MERITRNGIVLGISMLIYWLMNLLLLLPTFNFAAPAPKLLFGTILLLISLCGVWIEDDNGDDITCHVSVIIGVVIFLAGCIMPLIGSPLFSTNGYVESANISFVSLDDEESIQLPTEQEISSICLMDSETALQLATRKIGEDSTIVSQYNPGKVWTQSLNGETVKVVDLEYAGFFQTMNNSSIPKFVIVHGDSTTEVVTVDGGIKYAPSDIFSQDLMRHVRSVYKTELLGDYYFQVDDDLHPYWSVAVESYNTVANCKIVTGVILVDAVTGKMEKFALADAPQWMDCIITGSVVETYYNRYGRYNNGFWNFSKVNVSATTDDYGFVSINDDVFVYTGVTSVSGDESNIAFLLCNSRTGEMYYYTIGGAEEYSAMSAAEGVVANYGYVASFPSLVIYDGEPTYVMVLKDNNNLVKKYAMVNYSNYSIVVVADTLKEVQKSYVAALATSGTSIEINTDSLVETVVNVAAVEYIVIDGNTVVYVKSEDGKVYKEAFANDETLILINVGDTITVLSTNDGDINTLVEWR